MKIDVRVVNNIPDRNLVELHKNDEDLFMKYNVNSIIIVAQKKIDDNLSIDEIKEEILKYLEDLNHRCILYGSHCTISLIDEEIGEGKTKIMIDGKVFISPWCVEANNIVGIIKNASDEDQTYIYEDSYRLITNKNIEYVINHRKGA